MIFRRYSFFLGLLWWSLLMVCPGSLQAQMLLSARGPVSPDSLPYSEVNLPIQISLKPLFAMAEKGIPPHFSSPRWPHGWVMADCGTRFKYSFRRTPLEMNAIGNTFHLSFTGSYKVVGSTRACLNGAVLSPWAPSCQCGFSEGERKVNIGFSVVFHLQSDYTLKTSIRRTDPRALNACNVCFWRQDITHIIMDGLKKQLDRSLKSIRDSFSTINLRPYVLPVWQRLNRSYSFQELGWLQLNPDRLSINYIYARNDMLYISLGLRAKPVLRFEKPPLQRKALPPITTSAQPPGFNIFLTALLQYDSLSRIVNGRLRNHWFKFYQGTTPKYVVVKNVGLSINQMGHLKIAVDFDGSYKGTAIFRGRPYYNDSLKSIQIADIGFDLRTRNALLRTAKWLLNDQIIAELSARSTFNLSTYYGMAKEELNRQINKKWKGLQTSGSIFDVKLVAIQPLANHLLLRSSGSGRLSVMVTDVINWELDLTRPASGGTPSPNGEGGGGRPTGK
ncbi:DUF4403 family protein [Paraflavisolibacter sp. H34]|uniref:DUF4403 family protein n=1 Tax=Huijunlia imazamoxiresistens TaxID=3127457 RepID=UPI0030181F4F